MKQFNHVSNNGTWNKCEIILQLKNNTFPDIFSLSKQSYLTAEISWHLPYASPELTLSIISQKSYLVLTSILQVLMIIWCTFYRWGCWRFFRSCKDSAGIKRRFKGRSRDLTDFTVDYYLPVNVFKISSWGCLGCSVGRVCDFWSWGHIFESHFGSKVY